jgi:peptidoglycan-N-acetylglucosamine deacetylase
MAKTKLLASISLDLDNLWSYMKIHGDEGWEKYPSYFNVFIPHVLDLLDELELKITFFIVGKDAEIEENRKFLRMITERGHEVGNHSYNHESWLKSYSYEKIELEVIAAERAIVNVTYQKPVGFRGPGFSWSYDLFNVLKTHGYLYDASTLPTFLGPLARKYYFMKSNLSKEEKNARHELFGKFNDGFKKLKPYYINLNDEIKLIEIPVTTIPIFKLPFHQSYLVYISNISNLLMKLYLEFAIFMCRITKTPLSFLIHPLDLIGADLISDLSFFPGMNVKSEFKLRVFKYTINRLKKSYCLKPMSEVAILNPPTVDKK